METLVNSGISLSPALAAAPQEQTSEAALAFASRGTVGLGTTRAIHLLLTTGDTTGAQGHPACPTAPTPHTVHACLEMHTDTNNQFSGQFFLFAKTF